MHALTLGFGLGFLVAMQLGPMSLFLIRSTLRAGWAVGLAIGAGIALVDALYAAAGAAGAASLLAIDPLRTAFSLAGAAVLLLLGVRTLRDAFRVRLGAETEDEVASPRRAFLTSAAATASNPLTIASWAAVFAAASGVGATPGLLVIGVGAGSLVWVTLLATGTATARRALVERAMRAADALAGTGLLVFGCALALRAE
jgi:putative LysE/RhtB family amino acid efflux pump